MRRRDFITLLGGAAAAWPLAARAQQMRLIGVLISIDESDPEAQARVSAFRRGLEALGWVDRRNVRVEYRYVAGDARANMYGPAVWPGLPLRNRFPYCARIFGKDNSR